MKKAFFSTLFLLLAFLFTANSQILVPVKWSFDSKKINNEEFELILKVDIDKGWHIYGTGTLKEGPIPTSFKFKPSKEYELIGNLVKPEEVALYDEVFKMDISYFSDHASFKQRVKMKSDKPFQVSIEIEHQACNDRSCIAPEITEYAFDLPGVENSGKEGNKED